MLLMLVSAKSPLRIVGFIDQHLVARFLLYYGLNKVVALLVIVSINVHLLQARRFKWRLQCVAKIVDDKHGPYHDLFCEVILCNYCE